MSFIHIISTRFNVPTKSWTTTREGHKALSEEWLSDRFNLFTDLCFPSFKNQTNKNFIWLVFFDIHTPEKYLTKIENFKKVFENFNPVFVQDFEEMHSKLLELTASYCNENTKYVISTDIDNDDLLHKDFVNIVQKLYKPVHNLVIDLRKGLQITKIDVRKIFANEFYEVSNAFVSLVESVSDVKTVIKDKHTAYRNYVDIVCYDKEPMFIQLIHSNNLVNNTIGTKRLYNIQTEDFGIGSNYFEISKTDTLTYNTKRIFNRILKK